MGKITIFTLDGCPVCKKAVELLSSKTPSLDLISLTKSPEWTQLLFILTGGFQTVPQVFFNDKHVGGLNQLEELNQQGKLDSMVKECLESDGSSLQLRTPQASEFMQVIPDVLQEKWQKELETDLDPKLGGSSERHITGLLILMDTPGPEMVVVCSVGEIDKAFPPGSSGPKGKEGGQDKFYCQVAIERKETLFFDGPSTFQDGLKENFDHVQLGMSWYLGAPWQVRDIKGTVAILEKEAGILKPEHQSIAEGFRDRIVKDFLAYLGDSDK